MLEAVAQRCPSLQPFATRLYATPTPLWLRALLPPLHPPRAFARVTRAGHSSLSLALQGPLEELQELDLAQPLAHADNIFLQGTRGVVEAAFPPSRFRPPGTLGPAGHAFRVLGLLYSGSRQPGSVGYTGYAAYTQRDNGSCFSSRGGCFCGSPCKGMHIQGMPPRGCAGWAPLPTQDRWLLLQGFLQLRVVHLPWVDE